MFLVQKQTKNDKIIIALDTWLFKKINSVLNKRRPRMNAALENLINAPAFNRGNVVHGLSEGKKSGEGGKNVYGHYFGSLLCF